MPVIIALKRWVIAKRASTQTTPAIHFQQNLRGHIFRISLSLISAALLVLSFPDYNLWYLAWVAFVPLLGALAITPSVRQGIMLGLLFGISFFYGACYWITYPMIHYGGFTPLLAYSLVIIPTAVIGLFVALFAGTLVRLLQQFGIWAMLAAPLLWAATEYLRFHITNMGWNSLGYSQSFQPTIIWPARFGGVYLVSALILLVNALVALGILRLVRQRSYRALIGSLAAATAICLAIMLLASHTPVGEPGGEKLAVLAVQGNAPVGDHSVKVEQESLARQLRLTRENIPSTKPSLVVWPEAPFYFPYDTNEDLRREFGEFARRHQIYLLINASTGEKEEDFYNSIVVIGPTGERVGQYDKIQLLPFGEYVPLRNYLPFGSYLTALVGDFRAGNRYSLLQVEGYKLGAFICFESVFPEISREMARAGAMAYINIADDAWLGPTPVARQHLAHVIMRAVETGRPILRVTNTGISAYIAADGQVQDETPLFESAITHWQIVKGAPTVLTFYTRCGDLFAQTSLAITIMLLMASWARLRVRLQGVLKRGKNYARGTETEV
ncbi:MAG: apolipoprotein N-acyltransferase [Acidobacteriota bacterium]